MVTINKISFCDNLELGQFGKLNLYGFIPGDTISMDRVPYNFISHLVIWGNSSEPEVQLKLNLSLSDKSGSRLDTIECDLAEPVSRFSSGNPPFSLFVIIPISLTIQRYGSITVSVSENDSELYQESYKIVKGDSPNTKLNEHIPHFKVFSGNDRADLDFVIDLLATASRTLKVFDAYLNPTLLGTLLSKTVPGTKITIVTSEVNKPLFQLGQQVFQTFPNLEVKYSRKGFKQSHDRILVINDCEYYHFGHSIKDVASGKMSRCSKIVDKKELDSLIPQLLDIENQSV